jgi:hypothetical protein
VTVKEHYDCLIGGLLFEINSTYFIVIFQFGIHIGARIEDNRDTHCCNIWQPLADPKNASSAPIDVIFQNITGEGINISF